MSKRILIAAAVVVALLAVPLWLSRSQVTPVRVAAATRGPLVIKVATNGSVEPVEDVEVRAGLDGRLLEIRDAGAAVEAGDVLVRIDPAPVAAALKSARSQQLEAAESLRAARDTLARIERTFALDTRLREENALAEERFVESQAARDEARARVAFLEQEVPLRIEALDLEIADLEDQLLGTEVVSPVTGTVYRSEVEPGEVVRRGQLLLAVADLSRLQVRANIDQVDLGKVQVGNTIDVFSNAFPERRWNGTITEILPRVEMRENRAVSEAIAEIAPPVRGLVPGMNVDIEVIVRTTDEVLQIPSEAVFAAGEGPFVYRVEHGKAAARPVTLGVSSFTAVEVVRGLDAGDRVVLGPAPDLEDGMRVAARSADADED